MLTNQHAKLLTREVWGRIPPYEKGDSEAIFGGFKMTGGIVERAGVKGMDDGCTAIIYTFTCTYPYRYPYTYPYT